MSVCVIRIILVKILRVFKVSYRAWSEGASCVCVCVTLCCLKGMPGF